MTQFAITTIGVCLISLLLGYVVIITGGFSLQALGKANEEQSWVGKITYLIQGIGGIGVAILIPIAIIEKNGLPGIFGMVLAVIINLKLSR